MCYKWVRPLFFFITLLEYKKVELFMPPIHDNPLGQLSFPVLDFFIVKHVNRDILRPFKFWFGANYIYSSLWCIFYGLPAVHEGLNIN